MMDIVNPSTGEVYASAPNSDEQDVDLACRAAGAAFEKWRWSTPSERQQALLKLADVIEEQRRGADRDREREHGEAGRPDHVGGDPADGRPDPLLRRRCPGARGPVPGEYMRGFTSSIRREPVGPVAQVAPWNYPMMMAVWKFAPALAAGNTVVLKPSDTTPASSYWMVEKMQEIFPPGVCNLVCGDRDTGAALDQHKMPQLVSITGSTRAGIAVATAAARRQARPPRARRQGAGRGLRRRRHPGRDRGHLGGRALQRRPGLYGGHPGDRAARHLRRVPGRPDRSGPGTRTGYDPADEDILYGPINNANQLGHVSGLVERAPTMPG